MSAIRWTVELASGRRIEVGPEGAHDILTSDKERHQGATLTPEYRDAYEEHFGDEDEAETDAQASAEDRITHVGGGWYEVEGVEGTVKGKEAALEAAEGAD